MKAEVIIAAGGTGTRMRSRTPKALMPLAGQPLFLHALKVFLQNRRIAGVVLAVPRGSEAKFRRQIDRAGIRTPIKIVVGGVTRSVSVRNALSLVAEDTQAVLIHDAARPFVTNRIINQVLNALRNDDAVIVAVPVKPTIKRVDPKSGYVEATLDRSFLWDVQTPQGFHKKTIVWAHAAATGDDATDDALLVERLGQRVKVIPGEEKNMKITTPEDLALAQVLLNVKAKKR